MQYSDWVNAITSILIYDVDVTTPGSSNPTDNSAFNQILPRCIDYVENRLQRDLDLIGTTVTIPLPGGTPPTMVANQRLQTLPSTDLPAVNQLPALVGTPISAGSILTTTNGSANINVNWPAHGLTSGKLVAILNPTKIANLTLGGDFVITVVDANNFTIVATTNANAPKTVIYIGSGIFVVCSEIRPIVGGVKQQPLEPVTRAFLDFVWPSDASPGANIVPEKWCPNDQATFLVGPAPDQAYPFEAVGTMRIPQLSSSNYQNFLTINFADLYVALSMVFLFGYQRDFGAQSDDPKSAQSWENQYQTLKGSAATEEARKRFADLVQSPSNPTSVQAA